MGIASVARNAASSAATSASSSVASNAASQAAKAPSLGSTMPASGPASPKPASPSGSPTGKPNVDSPSSGSSLPNTNIENHNINQSDVPKGETDANIEQYESGQSDFNTPNEDNYPDANSERINPQDIDDGKYHARDNQELGPGQKLDENGNVVDTGNKKFTKALAVGAATYAAGVEGGEAANTLSKTETGNKLTGVVGDALDKTPIVGKVTEDLGDSGAADAVTDAADTISAAKSGDIKSAVKSGKSTLKNVKKTVKHYIWVIVSTLFTILVPILLLSIIIVTICGPNLGGISDVTNSSGEVVDNSTSEVTDNVVSETVIEDADQMISEIPNYESLPEPRKSIVTWAAIGIASGKPYSFGGKPTGPGLDGIPSTGLDCSGFVAWSIWSATNKMPSAQGTSTMIGSIGTLYEEISADELQPGDVGLKHKNKGANHTGVYAGNDQWFHAANSTTGLVKGTYKDFTVYLRYIGQGDF